MLESEYIAFMLWRLREECLRKKRKEEESYKDFNLSRNWTVHAAILRR